MKKNNKEKLNPNFVTGFTDAEGCFMLNVKHKNNLNKRYIMPIFSIQLHIRDKDLLLEIKSFFKDVGKIYIYKKAIMYRVRKLDDITNIIIPHFDRFPLISKKQSDYILFKNIVKLMEKGEHLNKEGLKKIVSLKASLNKGLSNKLKISFPDLIKIERPKTNLPIDIDYQWLAGFTSGDGCFYICICKDTGYKIGYSVKLRVSLIQHSRDEILIKHLINILDCGYTYKHPNENIIRYIVTKFEDINEKIIPLFKKYKIIGEKSRDFEDFCKVAKLINNKAHITPEGLEEIRLIKFRMNQSRYNN